MKRKLFLLIILITSFGLGRSEEIGIKSNLVSDALLSPNLGVEIGMAPRWTLNLVGQVNFWTVNGHNWRHWLAQPEARFWFCETFTGHFLGFHAIGGQYNFGSISNGITFLGSKFKNLTDYRYQGWGAGAGIAYGYAWVLAKHWNLEAEIGIGWIYTRFDKFSCQNCGRKLESNRVHNYVGPTKVALNLEYIF